MARRFSHVVHFTAAAAIACAAPVQAGGGGFSGPLVYQSGTNVYGSDSFAYLDQRSDFTFSPISHYSPKPDPGIGIGSTSGLGSIGASASVYANAAASLSGFASVNNSMAYQWRQHVDTLAAGADGIGSSTVGTPFKIGSLSHIDSHTITAGNGDFEAGLSAFANIGVGASLKACFLVCGSKDFGVGTGQDGLHKTLLDYSSAENRLTVLDQTYTDVLPQTYSDPANLFRVTAYSPDLAGTYQSTSQKVASLYTSTPLVGASFDVGSAIAQAFGIPTDILKGSILGFNYETFGAYLGAAINIEQTIAMVPLIMDQVYHFTSPVEIFNDLTQTWQAAGDTINLGKDQFATVRAPDTINLGLSVESRASFKVATSLDVTATLQGQIVVLHVDGHGLNASVLDGTFDIASVGGLFRVEDTNFTQLASVFEPAINLQFFAPVAACFGCTTGNYVTLVQPTGGAAPIDGTPNLIVKALNFGVRDCNDAVTTGCLLDTSVLPKFNYTRDVHRGTAAPRSGRKRLYEASATGFAASDAIAARHATKPPTVWSRRATDLQTLRRTYGGARPNIDVSAVPEPAVWLQLLAGFAACGIAIRRRRVFAAV